MTTTRDEREKAVRDAVKTEMADRGWSAAKLAREAKIPDSSTVRDFLNGDRWPSLTTQTRIERPLYWHTGAIREHVDDGSPLPPLGGDVTSRERVIEEVGDVLTAEERAELLIAVDQANGAQSRALLQVARALGVARRANTQ